MNLNPSEAQVRAGNYKKRHEKFQGLNLSIETPKGAERRGIGKDGNPWSVKMPHDYGYIKRTEGADGDQVDVYVGHHKKSPHVFIVDQHDADSGEFDEHKVMLGFASAKQAAGAYDRGFSDGKGPDRRRAMLHLGMDDFKGWLAAGNAKKSVKGFARGGRINKAEGGWVVPLEQTLGQQQQKVEPLETAAAKEPKYGAIQSGLIGAAKGASAGWNDEMEGLVSASGYPSWAPRAGFITDVPAMAVGAARSALSEDSRKAYETKRDEIRSQQKQAEEEHPVASTVGGLAGSLLLPTGKIGTVGQAAKAGAALGLVGGAGEGEGLAETAAKAGTGALFGSVLGAGLQKGMEYAGKGAGLIIDKISAPFRNMRDPEGFAIDKFVKTAQKDIDAGRALTPEQLRLAKEYNLPMVMGDMGGRELHSLARVAADMSPEAAAKMEQHLADRVAERPKYFENFLEGFTLAPNVRTARGAVAQEAKVANKAAYDEAISQGSQGFHSQIIDDLMQAPAMQKAVMQAGESIKNSLAAGRATKAYHEMEDGTKLPTLEFMDKVKQKLDDMYRGAARDPERKSEAADIQGIISTLRNELDTLFPKYKDARGMAAEFFKVNDAGEAGQEIFKLLNSRKLMDSGLLELLPKMKSAERGMVASGLITSMIDAVRADPKAINQILKPKGPQAQDVLDKIIGPRKRRELESMLQLDGAMNMLNQRVGGNSKTEQLRSFGKTLRDEIAYGGAGLVGGALLGGSINPLDPASWPGIAAGSGFKHGKTMYMKGVNEKFANKIADLVVSQDPRDFQKAASAISRNPWAKRALQQNYDKMIKISAPSAHSMTPLGGYLGTKLSPASEDQQ